MKKKKNIVFHVADRNYVSMEKRNFTAWIVVEKDCVRTVEEMAIV